MHIRCPHCHQPVELVENAPLEHIDCPSCGSQFNLLGEETVDQRGEAGRTLGHFELIERLGMGQFGTVWLARDSELDRQVAIKIPRQEELSRGDIELFLREARAAAQLHHPNIVSVHEVGRDAGTVYIVSDLVRGLTLADRLSSGRLTPREAAALCATIADALQHAHEAGVIHRDLKPSNIMLDADGRPHLMDFGLAKREAGEITMTMDGRILGTPAYMSPEQARGQSHLADARSDVYSLGTILFELLTGELPFRGNKRMLLMQIIHDEPPSPRKLESAIPRDLETICLRCLEKAPERRYATAREVADELRRYLAGKPIHARPITRVERTWRWCRRNPTVAGLAAAVAAALLAGTIISGYFAAELNQRALAESKARDEAVEARNEAAQRAIDAYESVVRAAYTQAHALRAAPQSERQKQSLARLREGADAGRKMKLLAAQSGPHGAENVQRSAAVWSEQLPSLSSEAAWWLTEASLERITELRVSFISREQATFSADGTLLAYCLLKPVADAPRIEIVDILSGAVRSRIELPQSCSPLPRRKEEIEHIVLCFSGDNRELLVARADSFDPSELRTGNSIFRPVFSLERYGTQSGELVEALPLAAGASELPLYIDPTRLSLQFSADRSRVLCEGCRAPVSGVPWPVCTMVCNVSDGRAVRTFDDARFFGATFGKTGDQVLALRHKKQDDWRLETVEVASGRESQSVAVDELFGARLFSGMYKSSQGVVHPNLFWRLLAGRSADGRWLAWAGGALFFWDIESGQCVPPLGTAELSQFGARKACALSSDGRILATVTEPNPSKNDPGGELELKTFPEGRTLVTHPLNDFPVSDIRYSSQPGPEVTLIAFLGNGYRVAVARRREPLSTSQIMTVWDASLPSDEWLTHSWPDEAASRARGRTRMSQWPRTPVNAVRFDASAHRVFLAHGPSGGVEARPLPDEPFDGPQGKFRTGAGAPDETRWRYASTRAVYESEVGPDSAATRHFNESGETDAWLSSDFGFDASSKVFVCPTRGHVDLYDAATGRLRQSIVGTLVGAGPSRRCLAVCRFAQAGGPRIALFDVAENKWLPELQDDYWAVNAKVNFSADGRRVWPDLREGFCLARVADGSTVYKDESVPSTPHKPVVDRLAKTALVCTSQGKTTDGHVLAVVNLEKGEKIAVIGSLPKYSAYSPRAVFGPEGDWLALLEPYLADAKRGSWQNRLKLWRRGSEQAVQLGDAWSQSQVVLFACDRNHFVVHGDKPLAANASGDRSVVVELWDASVPKLIRSSSDPLRHAVSICSGLAGSRLAVGYQAYRNRNDKWLEIWDVASGDILAAYPGDSYQKRGDCDQYLLAHVHDELRGWPTQIIDMATGKPSLTLDIGTPSKPIATDSYAWLAAGKWRVAPGSRGEAVVWNLEDKTGVPLPLRASSVLGLTADGESLAAYEPQITPGVQLWSMPTRQLAKALPLAGLNRLPGAAESPVNEVRFSPDGRKLALNVKQETRLANLDSQSVVAVVGRAGHGAQVRGMDLSADGRWFATASDDQTVGLWDARDGGYRAMIDGFPSAVRGCAFFPDSQRLAAIDSQGRVTVWRLTPREADDLPAVEVRLVWQHTPAAEASSARAPLLTVNPDGGLLATVSAEATITLHDADNGKVVRALYSQIPITCLAFVNNGRWLAVGDSGGRLRLYEARTGDLYTEWDAGQGAVHSMATHPNEDLLVTAGRDVRLWSALDGQLLLALDKHSEPVRDVTFSRDGRLLASAGDDRVNVWRLTALGDALAEMGLGWTDALRQRGQPLLVAKRPVFPPAATPVRRRGPSAANRPAETQSLGGENTKHRAQQPSKDASSIEGHHWPVTCVAYSHEGRLLASGDWSGAVRVWDSAERTERLIIKRHAQQVWGVAFLTNGRRLATCGDEGTIRISDVLDGRHETLIECDCPIHALACHPDGKTLAAAGDDGAAYVFDAETGEKMAAIVASGKPLWGVAYSPDGARLATSGVDPVIRLWDATSGQPAGELTGHTNVVWSLAFSPDGSRLASASDDWSIRIWDAAALREVATLTGHTISPYNVSFSRDGRLLASAAGHRWKPPHPGEVIVWTTSTWQGHTYSATANGFFAAAFTPDGHELAGAGSDGRIRLWKAP